MINKCLCGGTPKQQVKYSCCEVEFWYMCDTCGKLSPSRWEIKDAAEEWNKLNMCDPKCLRFNKEDFCCTVNGKCVEDKKTQEEYLKKDIESKVHAQNKKDLVFDNYFNGKEVSFDCKERKSLLDTTFGAGGYELLGMYKITEKGELVLKENELEELKKRLEVEKRESDFWYSENEKSKIRFWEKESELIDLKKEFNNMKFDRDYFQLELKNCQNKHTELKEQVEKDKQSFNAIIDLVQGKTEW
jgi:hypothetical protein